MASTYSDLKIELIGTGEQVGTWGNTTNTNLGTALGEAITGSATVTFSSVDVTLTLSNTNGSQTARNLRLVCAGTSGGARNLILGSGCQIEKLYLIQNDLADTVTVKNTTGTGVAVLAGAKVFVFNDGTNVVTATNLTGTSGTLPIVNGGTGATDATTALSNLGGVTTAGARAALSFSAGSGAYNSGTGVITIPTNNNQITNGAGYTTNTGTVTSVSGTGTASGLSLSGNVTTTGNLTLSGTVNSLAAGTYGINITGSAPYGSLTGKPASALREIFNGVVNYNAVATKTYTFTILYSGSQAREMVSPDSFVVVTALNDSYLPGADSTYTVTKEVKLIGAVAQSKFIVTLSFTPGVKPLNVNMRIFIQDVTAATSLTLDP